MITNEQIKEWIKDAENSSKIIINACPIDFILMCKELLRFRRQKELGDEWRKPKRTDEHRFLIFLKGLQTSMKKRLYEEKHKKNVSYSEFRI